MDKTPVTESTRFVHLSLSPAEVRTLFDVCSTALCDYDNLLVGATSRSERDRISQAIDELTPVFEYIKCTYNSLSHVYGK